MNYTGIHVIICIVLQLLAVVVSPSQNVFQKDNLDFGNDIIINNQPLRDQQPVATCSTREGWIYHLYIYRDSVHDAPAFTLSKSLDNGISWTIIHDSWLPVEHTYINSADIEIIGDAPDSYKLIFAYNATIGINGGVHVYRFNAITGEFEDGLLDTQSCRYVSLCSDPSNFSPSTGHNVLGLLVGRATGPTSWEQRLYTSDNNGLYFNGIQITVAHTSIIPVKGTLSFGRSISYPEGRFHAVWDERSGINASDGHSYVARTTTGYNSAIGPTIMLDSFAPPTLNNALINPVIACQSSTYNNNQNDYSQVILCEYVQPTGVQRSIVGFANTRSMQQNVFNYFQLSPAGNDCRQPSVAFNAFDSSFYCTYFDNTLKKLIAVKKNFQLTDPGTWETVSSGYNDSEDLSQPWPLVSVNHGLHQPYFAWVGNNSNNLGVALFDAPYIISGDDVVWEADRKIIVYPNPCHGFLKIRLPGYTSDAVTATITDVLGHTTNLSLSNYQSDQLAGEFICDIRQIPKGVYILRVNFLHHTYSTKFITGN